MSTKHQRLLEELAAKQAEIERLRAEVERLKREVQHQIDSRDYADWLRSFP